MQIEIALPGRMAIAGSALFKSIQNSHTPILDLLVRESIQNSLDASIDGTRQVKVDFHLGQFAPRKVNNLLETISEELNKRYPNERYDYIAICDTNTVGLTGPLNIYDVENEKDYGNLIKLVYEISKPQTQKSAGGSWGLGKTIYFRVGIGLVFYYSRIKNDLGNYESRLAVALVEDEQSDKAMIPPAKGFKIKRGIAWWGNAYPINSTIPLTDENEIEEILSYFELMPFQNNETGTKIIIPYINKQELLDNNCPYIQNEAGEYKLSAPWYSNIEEYLRIAVQRWYAPRLNNSRCYGAMLNVSINGNYIKKDDIEPVFRIFQELYNIGIGAVSNDENEFKIEEIKIREALEGSSAGKLIYKNVSSKDLGMLPPDNLLSPETYCNLEIDNKDQHKPIFAFTRKIGMVVSIENNGKWLEGVPSTDEDNYLLAFFVPDSEKKLQKCKNITLDEYLRESEHADHTSWNDHSNQRIIKKIQDGVKKQLAKALKKDDEKSLSGRGTSFSRTLGDLLLPKLGFGNKPSDKPTQPNSNGSKNGGIVFSIDPKKTIYSATSMEIEASWAATAPLKKATISLAIGSEGSSITASEWENLMGLSMPFEIESASIAFLKAKGRPSEEFHPISKAKVEKINDQYSLELRCTSKGIGNTIVLSYAEASKFKSRIRIKIKFLDMKRDKMPTFLLERGM